MPRDGLTSEQRRAVILESLAKCFGPEALEPTGYVEQDWGAETYTRGCVSPLAKGVLTRHGPALGEPTGRVLWSGTETAMRWSGYLDGAVRGRAAGRGRGPRCARPGGMREDKEGDASPEYVLRPGIKG